MKDFITSSLATVFALSIIGGAIYLFFGTWMYFANRPKNIICYEGENVIADYKNVIVYESSENGNVTIKTDNESRVISNPNCKITKSEEK